MSEATVNEALALRYRVFAGEMGARLKSEDGFDRDRFDPFCDHLVVRDHHTGKIVGCTRLLSERGAERAGGFYSEQEFDLGAVRQLPGKLLEVGRTCVDRNSRGGIVLAVLWSALSDYALKRGFSYLMGCASIPPGPNGFAVEAFYRKLRPEQQGPAWLTVSSRRPVPKEFHCARDECGVPPLLETYLRLGAWVCGDPYWDEDFNCMDVFILLPLANLQGRYVRRFFEGHAQAHGLAEGLS
ncbi:MAG: GNAT family N-acetyltransferase [Methylohalobius sp.]|nr:GNAT family N-acetyltransferase [Methylohalobius sp.]